MPVSIPPFSNVPAPGDPIQSAWAQQLTQHVVNLGVVGTATGAFTDAIGSTPKTIVGSSVTFAAKLGRLYLITVSLGRVDQNTAASTFVASVTDAAGAAFKSVAESLPAGSLNQIGFAYVEQYGAAGNITRKLMASTSSGSAAVQDGSLLLVQDIGDWPLT